jgi:transcriptional regulator with XRE-family HTH domain
MITLGNAIRRLRQAAGLTQKDLAERLEVDKTYVSHLEADRKEPSIQLLRGLASVLEVPPGLLLAVSLWTDLPAEQKQIYQPIIDRLIEIATAGTPPATI